MSSDLIIVFILQAAGIGVILAEFLIPSAGLLSALASAMIGYSLYLVYASISVEAGVIFTIADVILIPLVVVAGIKLLYRSPLTLSASLESKKGYQGEDSSLKELIGKSGTTLTTLRPSGMADIEDKRVDVISSGDFIEKGTRVMVSGVDGNRVVVTPQE